MDPPGCSAERVNITSAGAGCQVPISNSAARVAGLLFGKPANVGFGDRGGPLIAVVAAVSVVEKSKEPLDICDFRPPGIASRVDFGFQVFAKGTEFIRRFLLHVLPSGLMKIRHYGYLANRYRKKKLALCRELLGVSKCLLT